MKVSVARYRQDARTIWRDLSRDGKGWILLMVGAGWFLSLGLRYVYPSMIPFFRDYFGFDLTIAGLLLSALWVAYALGQIPGGILGDRLGEGNILVISTGLSMVAVLLVALSVNLWMLFIGTIIFGLATALYGPTRFTIFTDIYTERAGTAIGLTYAAGSIGNAVLPATAAAIASYTTWRLGYGWMVPLFLGVTIALWIVVPSRTSSVRNAAQDLSISTVKEIFASLTIGGIPLLVSIHVLLGFVSQGFLGFYPIYLIDVKGFTAQTAAILFGMYFAFGAIVQPLAGMSRDRFGSRATLVVICTAYFLGMVTLYFAQTFVHVLILTALLSYRNATGVITNTYIANTLPERVKGTGLGTLRTVWILIGATSPVFVGFLGDLGFLDLVILLLAGIVAVSTIMAVFIPQE